MSYPFCESKRSHAFVTATELFDGDTGDPPKKDSIQECQRKAMGAASGQTITGNTSPLEQHGLRRERKDGSLQILDCNTEIKRRLQRFAHRNEDGHRRVDTRVHGVSFFVF